MALSSVADDSQTLGSRTVRELRSSFRTGKTRSLRWRMQELDAMRRMLEEQQETIIDAICADLGKPRFEAFTTEIGYTISEIEHIQKRLRSWMKPERVKSATVVQPAKSKIYKDPLGVVLVIGAWNYPFQLSFGPAIGAIAAGNCVVIKPSEVSANTSKCLAELIPRYMDQDSVRVVEGGIPETTDLLEQKWDHIFYTGNGTVGRIVMSAAAKHLTPVTLELGGKSPTIIDSEVDLDVACRRIVWGKYTNAGQTCVAPDYVLCHRKVYENFLDTMRNTITEFYGADPKLSGDYGRIINERHFDRLMKLADSGTIVCGGDSDREARYIAPTVLRDVSPDSPIMADEIFGPFLPVLPINDIDEAIDFVTERPKPLALYVFSKNKDRAQRVVRHTSSGGGSINHVWMHLACPSLPFGGVGESGMGAYHGKHSFDVFTHHKSILEKPTLVDPNMVYPPYTDFKKKLIKKVL